MNHRSLSVLFVSLFLLPLLGLAQEKIPTSTYSSQASILTNSPDLIFDGKIWCYLRFSQVPSESQKANLTAAGVKLHQYEPDLIWFASFPKDLSALVLDAAGVAGTMVKAAQQKADVRLVHGTVPVYAQKGNGIEAAITIAATGEYAAMKGRLEEMGISIQNTFDPLGILYVNGSNAALIAASQLPFVIYVELPEPPAELEIEDEMTTTRGAYINGYYNLNGVTGDGITIAVNEGGIVDNLYDPDFKNRLDRSLESGGISGHKTGVSWRMASAGNINPIHRGQAWGAELQSGGINFTNAASNNVNIVNNSFGYGCIPAGPTYNTGSATNDFLVRNNDRFMITYSCGNIGGSNCANYGAGPGWGNITGLVKSAKNIFAVGAMNTDDQLTGFSSRGPAMDGRILPDITATGPGGTSHASPNLAGVNALLTEAYRNENSNQWPNSGLIKAIILNTADDIENPGPDYKSGFGRINAHRALEVIENDQFLTNSVGNTSVQTNTINVPAGVSQLKISIYWNDKEATAGITGKTLVNDLDLRVQLPSSAWVQPWVLNPFPHPDSLELDAVQGTDTLNNVELVTIDNPVSGNYLAEVTGALVPFGPQVYRVVYSFVYDSITVIYPRGGEGLVPGENRRIRWDAFDSGNTFDIEFSSDSGAVWQSLVSGLASNIRSYTWNVPTTISGNCLVRVNSGNQSATSKSRFTIVPAPANLNLVWRCADSAVFSWDTVAGALGYRVYRLDNKYMDTAGFTQNPYTQLYNLSATETEWVSVQVVLPDSGSGRRAIALSILPGDFNCNGEDLSITQLISPEAGHYPTCVLSDSLDLTLRLQNTGTTTLSYLPVAFQFNGGAIFFDTLFAPLTSAAQDVITIPSSVLLQVGNNTLTVWSTYPGDGNPANDTLHVTIVGYSGTSASLPYTQNFDNFTNCSTAWGCASITCNLSLGWFNLPNQNAGDSIDWRTHNGSTGSGGTGPSGDHTSGTGKYLYLEGSGNGGGGCSNKEAQLHSPCFDLTGTNVPTISYWYHAFGGAIGSLHLDVLSEGQWHLDVAPQVVGAQGNQWLQQQADLSAFSGQEVIVRFRGITGGSWQTDLAIDDINLTSLPLANFETIFDTFCLGQTVPLQNLTTFGNSYSWTILQNTFTYDMGNSSTQSPTILPTDTGWYDVQLISSNASGQDTLLISDFFYVIDFDPPTLMSDAPNNTYCFGESGVFTASGDGSTFHFFHNGIPVQSGSNPVWISPPLNQWDYVWVKNEVNFTCSQTSLSVHITVQEDLDGTTLWADDPDLTICAGDIVSFATQDGLDDYVFNINTIPQQNGMDSLFQTNALMDGDFVYAQITDSLSCTGNTDSLFWKVHPIPATPTIVHLTNDSLEASVVASKYQWWRNTSQLPDTTQIIVAVASGSYKVQAIDSGCVSDFSDEFEHFLVGIEEFNNQAIRLFPNPARTEVYLFMEKAGYDQAKLFDKAGRSVLTQPISAGTTSLSIESLAAGVYSLQLFGEAGSLVFKLVVE